VVDDAMGLLLRLEVGKVIPIIFLLSDEKGNMWSKRRRRPPDG